LRPARLEGCADPAARRGGDGDRQDARLSRARDALGARGRRGGVGLDLHQGAATPARPRGRTALPRPAGAPPAHGRAQGPQISLAGSYSVRDRYNDGLSSNDSYSVGLQANLNLFDGGAAKARAAQSKTNIAIAESQFASQRDQIRFDVEQYYFQLQSNLNNVQTSSVALNQANQALDLARLRFQNGVGTQTEVIAAENDLTRAEGNRITAILDYNRALANLQRSVTSRAFR
ncbi:hypothetical protein VF02_37790, partial [Nostoc linckia z1]